MNRSGCPAFAFGIASLFLSSCLLSCSSQRNPDEDFRQEIETPRGKSVPFGAKIVSQTEPARNNWSVTARWEIETTMTPGDYSKWVTAQLEPEFKFVKAEESHLIFSKHEHGDTHSIECALVATENKLHVHVEFRAAPD